MTDTPNEADATPKLTPTQRLHEVTLAALTRKPVTASEEVEVTRNAKGDYQFTVCGVAGEGETLAECASRVVGLAGRIEAQLPLSRAQQFARKFAPDKDLSNAREIPEATK